MRIVALVVVMLVLTVVFFGCGGKCTGSTCPPGDVVQACDALIEAICERRVECGTVSDMTTCLQTMGAQAQCDTGTCGNKSYAPQKYQTCHDLVLSADCSAATIATGQLNMTTVGCDVDPFCS